MKKFNSGKAVCFLMMVGVLTMAITAFAQQKTKRDETKKDDKSEMSCPMMDKMAGGGNKSHEDCPMMKKSQSQAPEMKTDDMSKHSEHHQMVMENGEKAMGFSQTATTHHFLIMKDGGAIQVQANDIKDTETSDKIRAHLTEIAREFQNGIFTTPFAVHGQVPPGAAEMDELKSEIRYTYEETERGARVRITTLNRRALSAIHDFLKFQIKEHQTDDAMSVEN